MLFEKEIWKEKLEERVLVKFGVTLEEASSFEIYQALGDTVMEKIAKNWYDTKKKYEREKQAFYRSEEHTSELQSRQYLVCRLLLEKKNTHRFPFSSLHLDRQRSV